MGNGYPYTVGQQIKNTRQNFAKRLSLSNMSQWILPTTMHEEPNNSIFDTDLNVSILQIGFKTID